MTFHNSKLWHTDKIPVEIEQQYEDNLRWLAEAEKHKLVVGSQARILYSDQIGRVRIAQAFNEAVASGRLKVQKQSIFFLAWSTWSYLCFQRPLWL